MLQSHLARIVDSGSGGSLRSRGGARGGTSCTLRGELAGRRCDRRLRSFLLQELDCLLLVYG